MGMETPCFWCLEAVLNWLNSIPSTPDTPATAAGATTVAYLLHFNVFGRIFNESGKYRFIRSYVREFSWSMLRLILHIFIYTLEILIHIAQFCQT